jgi:glycine/D-amino acid oxidase-like deaminating enzyme
MTRKMDLRTGRPIWSHYRASIPPTKALFRDIKTDVLIVGMGISGAMIGEALTGAGLSVAAIDRRGAIKGSTAATTALIQYEVDTPLSYLSRKIGGNPARQVWRRTKLAVANLASTISELNIRCDMMHRRSLYLAGDTMDADELQEEAEARKAAGLEAIFLSRRKLRERFGINRSGAILSFDNLVADPRKLAAGLLARAAERGARLYAPVEATAFSSSADRVIVSTQLGPHIEAKYVILATGYELVSVVPSTRHSVVSTYAIATPPLPGRLPFDLPLIWEASDPYLYLRLTRDNRVICGGEDEPFVDQAKRDALLPEKAERILAKAKALLPVAGMEVAFAWAGAFGVTETGLPFIGPVPRHPRLYAVMGYGGNGLTFSRIAAELIRSELTGGKDHDAEHFALKSKKGMETC